MFTYGPGMTAIIILTVNKLGIALQFSFYIRHLLMSIIQVTYLSTKGFSNLTIGYHIAILCFAKYNLYHESVLWIRNPGLLRFGFLFQRVKLLQQNFLHPYVFNWSKKWNARWAQQTGGIWWIHNSLKFGSYKKILLLGAVVVAELVEQSLQTTEIHGSSPVITNFI